MNAVTSHPVFGVAVTVIAYAIAGRVQARWRWMPTLVTTCGLLMGLLLVDHISLDDYHRGGDLVTFFLGPATIALGVPLYKQFARIRRHAAAVGISVLLGSIFSIAAAALAVKIGHGSDIVFRSMLPKGVTTPIAIELSKPLHGVPELSAVFAVLGGLFGSIIGPKLLRLCGIHGDIAIGLAMGTSSHGIGTARVVRDSELQAGASGLAMGLAGIITSVLIALIALVLR